MSDEMIFYTNPMSRGRVVRWMLEEVGEPYRVEVVDYGPAMKSAGYKAMNPMGKVPVLKHGATIVTETAAICAYLADAFPQAGLAPALSSKERGAYYRWLFFGAGPLEAATTDRSLGVEVPPEKSGWVGYGSYNDVMDTLETILTGTEYLAGGRFSAADVYIGSQLAFGMRFGTMEKRPAFEAYVQRLQVRPAAIRANDLDDALMPAPAPSAAV